MTPENFEQANCTLKAPKGMKECGELAVFKSPDFRGNSYFVSAWRVGWRERLLILFSGRVWLWVFGFTHPPVAVEGRDPWKPEKKKKTDESD